MAKQPRKPREVGRSTDVVAERVPSRPSVRRANPREDDLSDQPPAFVAPCLPTLVRTPPPGPEWAHEIEHDGYRAVSMIRGATSRSTPGAAMAGLRACRTSTPHSRR
jgi:bifunctional non-homologous end joining protein LigD